MTAPDAKAVEAAIAAIDGAGVKLRVSMSEKNYRLIRGAARAWLDAQQTRQQHVAGDERLDVFEDYSGPDTKDPT